MQAENESCIAGQESLPFLQRDSRWPVAVTMFTVISGDCRQATVTFTPMSLTLQPSQSDTGGTVRVTCQASRLESGDRLLAMNIIRTVGNTETTLLSARSSRTHAVLEPGTGLTGVSVYGGIIPGAGTSTMALTLTQARCDQDEGVYTCKITVHIPYPVFTRDYFDRKNLSIEGENVEGTQRVTGMK